MLSPVDLNMQHCQTPPPNFFYIRLAEQIFPLIFGLAEFLHKLKIQLNIINLADTPDIQNKALQHVFTNFLAWY